MAQDDLTPDQALDALRKLPEDRQRAVLSQLPPDTLKAIRAKLEAPQDDFTSNPKGEGLYRMSKTAPGSEADPTTYLNAGPGDEIQIPYSRVQDALDAGYRLHADEKPRYYKDRAHVGGGPTPWENLGKALEPTPGPLGEAPVGPYVDLNTTKAAGRVLYGLPQFVSDLAFAAARMGQYVGDDSKDFLGMLDPSKVPEQLYKQFHADLKTNPTLAVDNLKGSLIGLGMIAAVTHGASKVVPDLPTVKSAGEGVRGFVREQLEMPQRIERTVKQFGEQSEDARTELRAARQKTGQQNVEEIRKQNEAKEDVNRRNQEVLRDRTKRQDTQQKLDAASKELDDKIIKAEKDAKAADDAAWKTWRDKVANVQVDMQPVVDAIKAQTDKMSPEQVATFKEIMRETAPAEEDLSEIDQTRNSIAKNAGYDKPYADLPPDRKAVIDEQIKRVGLAEAVDEATGEPAGEAAGGGGGGLKKMPASRLHGWKTQLEDAVRADRVGNVKYAIGQVLHVVRKLEEDVSKEAGADDDLKKARALHGPFQDTFRNSQTTPNTVANYVKSKVSPTFARDAKLEDFIAMLGKYDPSIPKLAQHIDNLQTGLKALPKEAPLRTQLTVPPAPPAGTEGLGAKHPVLAAPKVAENPLPKQGGGSFGKKAGIGEPPDITKLNQQNLEYLNDALRRYGKIGPWVFRFITGGLIEHLIRGGESAFGGTLTLGQAGLVLATKVLRGPGVLEWLARPSAEDLKVIATLPPEDAARLRASFKLLADEEVRQHPEKAALRDAIPASMAVWLGGSSTEQQQQPPALPEVKKQGEQLQAPPAPPPAPPAAPPPPPGPQASVAAANLQKIIESAQALQGGGGPKPVWSHVYSEELGRIIPV